MDLTVLRGTERLLIVLMGGLCIYLGYRLFSRIGRQDQSPASGEMKLPGLDIRLTKVAPGIFFCALGAIILVASVFAALRVKNDENTTLYITPEQSLTVDSVRPLLKTLTTLENIMSQTDIILTDKKFEKEATLLKQITTDEGLKTAITLLARRDDIGLTKRILISALFSEEVISLWNVNKDDFESTNITSDQKQVLRQVQALVNEDLRNVQ